MKERNAKSWQLTLAFATTYLVWGSTYLGIRYAVETIPPLLMAGTRFLVAGGILYGVSLQRTGVRPKLHHWRTALVLGFLLLVCGNGAVTTAEQWVPSGMAALLITSEPLWIVILNWLRPRGKAPTGREIFGVLLGFGGVGLLLSPQLGAVSPAGAPPLWASLMIVGSALAWATGSLYAIHASAVSDQPMANGMTMLAGGLMMIVGGLGTGEARHFDIHRIAPLSVVAWAYLVVFGSLAAFSAFVFLMRNTSPSKASTYAFVNPVVAVLLGWSVAGEHVDARSILAIVIIVGAVAVLQTARSRQPQPSTISSLSTRQSVLETSSRST